MGTGPPEARRKEFEEEALPHLDALFNLAISLTRSRKDAEDLVQEAYLRAFRFFDTYRSGTNIKAWLFRILRNTFINRYRAAKVRPDEVDFSKIESGYEQMIQEDYRSEHSRPTPEKVVMDGVLDHEVRDAIDALPAEYRVVVLLALVEELSYKEISAALSIPLGTVMSRLHRGRKLLQSRLTDYARKRGIIRGTEPVSDDGGGGSP